jgi:hypothetical protein
MRGIAVVLLLLLLVSMNVRNMGVRRIRSSLLSLEKSIKVQVYGGVHKFKPFRKVLRVSIPIKLAAINYRVIQ